MCGTHAYGYMYNYSVCLVDIDASFRELSSLFLNIQNVGQNASKCWLRWCLKRLKNKGSLLDLQPSALAFLTTPPSHPRSHEVGIQAQP